ncbi:RHS repeat protein, partial [Burkholderia cepacia]|nr:RHS repeat protein [Burkholderia cepacia]
MTSYTDCSGKITRFAYDARGTLARVTDAMG